MRPAQMRPEHDQSGAGLRLDRLCAGYGRRAVIHELSAGPLPAGRLTVLMGPNGSGKSTLLKTVAGLLPARGGAMLLDGADLAGLAGRQRVQRVCYMPQSLPAAVHLRVLEAVLTAGRAGAMHGTRPAAAQAQAVLDELGIGPLSLHYLDALSGGQKQLAGLAQALVRQPRVLLLDEPLSALDIAHQFQVMDVLRRETVRRGIVTVLVLHDVNTALRHADHALLLRQGELISEGSPGKVIDEATLAQVYGVRGRVQRPTGLPPYVVVDGVLDQAAATAYPGSGSGAAPATRTD